MSPVARLTPASVAAPAQHAGRGGMAPARRVFIALLVGLVWIGPAWLNWRFLYALAAWDVLVVLAWYGDLKRLPPPQCLKTSRAWAAPLAQGDSASVRVSVLNKSQVILEVSLQDELPASWLPPPASSALSTPRPRALPQLVLTARSGQAVGAEYRIRPSERGDHRVGRVCLRYRTAWQLAERWAFADLCQTVRVYLSLQRSKRQALYLARSRQVEMEKRLERRRGLGREFESLREYRRGDEMRDVCWTATARRGKLITRTYRSERSQRYRATWCCSWPSPSPIWRNWRLDGRHQSPKCIAIWRRKNWSIGASCCCVACASKEHWSSNSDRRTCLPRW